MAAAIQFYGVDEVYSESGVDLTQLRANLAMPAERRIMEHRRSLRSIEALRSQSLSNAMPMSDLDAEGLLRVLTDSQVEFVLIGGLAMIAQGSAYVTKDLDVCYDRAAHNIDRVVAALGPLHPYLRGAPLGPFLWDARTDQAGANFTLTTDLGDLDLLGHVSGLGSYAESLAYVEVKTLFGMSIQVLSIDGLIAAKKAAGRTKDKLHLLELEELKQLRASF